MLLAPAVRHGNELGDDDAGGGSASRELDRGDGQLGQAAAGDGEDADRADLALVDVQEAAVGAEPGVDGAGAGSPRPTSSPILMLSLPA
jgi:hypothetical protein